MALIRVRTFARTICPTVRLARAGTSLVLPAATRSATSAELSQPSTVPSAVSPAVLSIDMAPTVGPSAATARHPRVGPARRGTVQPPWDGVASGLLHSVRADGGLGDGGAVRIGRLDAQGHEPVGRVRHDGPPVVADVHQGRRPPGGAVVSGHVDLA